jgi:hypothetical protein
MAKFDPENAVIPDTDFSDKNSAERFLDCGKFRPCANLLLLPARRPEVLLYVPTCWELRFQKKSVAEIIPMPDPRVRLDVVTAASIPDWAGHISCPRDCKGYRSKCWNNLCTKLFGPARGTYESWLAARGKRAKENSSSEGSALGRAFSNGWVQGLGCAFLAALVGLVSAEMTHTAVRAAIIVVASTAGLTLLVFAAVVAADHKN